MNLAVPHQTAAVHYTLEVIEKDGSARLAQPRKRNLILDCGLNAIGANSTEWKDCCFRVACGTSTAPTKRDSGTITFTRVGNTVVSSAAFFAGAADIGRLIKFDSGEEMYVISDDSTTSVIVDKSGNLPASEGTVWYVEQTGLFEEIDRVNSVPLGASYFAGAWTHGWQATFNTVDEVTVIREIGWIMGEASSGTFFGRDLLAGEGVALLPGQQLRVTVELSIQIGPLTPQPYSNVVSGWTSDGEQMLVSSFWGGPIGSGGPLLGAASVATDDSELAFVGPNPVYLPPRGLLAYAATASTGYTPGSFQQVRRAVFGPSSFESAAIRSLYVNNEAEYGVYRVRLNTPEAKTALQSLTLDFRFTWGRVLVN